MQNIKFGNNVIEDFTVTDNFYNGITGLNIGNFSLVIYDNNNTDKTVASNPFLTELGNGNYRLTYTPISKGIWSVVLKHPLYFPYGKGGSSNVVDYDITTIGDLIKRVLGLSQENYYIYDTVYDEDDNMISSKIRLYKDNSSFGSTNNILQEYVMNATYVDGNLETYTMGKV